MIDQGSIYIYNMCDQSITITLNKVEDPKAPLEKIAKEPPYGPSYHLAERTPDPAPFKEWAFGSGHDSSTNELEWYIGPDVRKPRKVELSLTQLQSQLQLNIQLYLFYDAAVLRWAGHSEAVKAKIEPSAE